MTIEGSPNADPIPESDGQPPKRRSLTPEQRRFLGTPRIKDEPAETEDVELPEVSKLTPPTPSPQSAPAPERDRSHARPVEHLPTDEKIDEETGDEQPEREASKGRSSTVRKIGGQQARASEMQRAFVVIGILASLGITFYVGMRIQYWKYLFSTSRNAPKLEAAADKFPGVSSDELVVQALHAQRAGKLQEAAERFIAAKHKNLAHRGILFRVGLIGYDSRDYDTADKLLERAIAFGENIELANYYRGLIAVRRKDLTAAQRFFAAAMEAAPFVADYHYYYAEALRMNHQPNEAIPRYEHGALLARNEQDATVCEFKKRMARLEAADAARIATELIERQREGALSVDWLMTAAALHIREGRPDEAMPLLQEARAANQPGLFSSCVNDFFFVEAAQRNPTLALAIMLDPAPAEPGS